MTISLEQQCLVHGLRVSGQRKTIFLVISKVKDRPCVEDIHQRVIQIDSGISLAITYRTLDILSRIAILNRVEFGDGKAHYELERNLINLVHIQWL